MPFREMVKCLFLEKYINYYNIFWVAAFFKAFEWCNVAFNAHPRFKSICITCGWTDSEFI